MNDELKLRTAELIAAIEALCLGSVTQSVIEAAVEALHANWNDHNSGV